MQLTKFESYSVVKPNAIIPIASDHAGFKLKETIIVHLANLKLMPEDLGTYSEKSCDYPDYIHKVAEKIEKKEAEIGICICKSGQGASITANKHKGVRSALCWNREIAELSRQHNDANVLTLPAGFISTIDAILITTAFFNTKFKGERHQRRIKKIEK